MKSVSFEIVGMNGAVVEATAARVLRRGSDLVIQREHGGDLMEFPAKAVQSVVKVTRERLWPEPDGGR